jgi:hypothetical protein
MGMSRHGVPAIRGSYTIASNQQGHKKKNGEAVGKPGAS